jgi:molybdate transport system permease protein
MPPLVLSLRIAIVSTILAALVAVPLAHRAARRPGLVSRVLSVATTLPLMLPPTVLGYYLLTVLGPGSALGRTFESIFGRPIAFTELGAVLAAALTALPAVFQGSRAAFEDLDPSVVEVARTLGARPVRVFYTIELPLARAGIGAGLLLGFARSLGDFGATMMIAGSIPGRTRTASIAIWDSMQGGDPAEANHLAAWLTGIGFVCLFALGSLSRRRR